MLVIKTNLLMLYCEFKFQKAFLLAFFTCVNFHKYQLGEPLLKYTPWDIFSKDYRHIPIWTNIRYGGPSYNGFPDMFCTRHAIRKENNLNVILGRHFCRVWHTRGEDKLKEVAREYYSSLWMSHVSVIRSQVCHVCCFCSVCGMSGIV